MLNRVTDHLNSAKQLLLLAIGILAIAAPFLISMMTAPRAWAQTPPPNAPTFEVAAIKPFKELPPWEGMGDMGSVAAYPGGRWEARRIPLLRLIGNTYRIWCCPMPAWQLTAGKEFREILSERYDIDAKAPPGSLPGGVVSRVGLEQMRPMVKALLTDRFKLAIRSETKEGPVYALVVARNGPRFKPSKIEEKDCDQIENGAGTGCHSIKFIQNATSWGFSGEAMAISDVVAYLLRYMDRPVIDKTGLTGLFDIHVEVPRPENRGEWFDAALRELGELGLKLEPQKGPVETLVIDRVERPSEN
jgi:uncharacterized protein (TIGR03435 family)